MVLTKKTIRKPAYRRRGVGMRRRMGRVPRPLKYNANRVGGPNTCRISQTLPTIALDANTPYRISVGGITGDRVRAVCEQFALYRISKVEFKYKPYYDTFTPGQLTTGNSPANILTTVPRLYWKMNRFADAPAQWAVQDLKDMGAKPIRFDEKTVTIAYKPNILLANESGGSVSGSVKMTPWLNTDDGSETSTFAPSTTEHYGHFFYIEADAQNGQTDPGVGSLDVTIYYEFKNPRVEWTPEQEGGKLSQNPLKLTDGQVSG